MKEWALFLAIGATLLGACASTADNAERESLLKLAKEGKISWREKDQREYEIVKRHRSLSPALEAYWAKRIALSDKVDKKLISPVDADAIDKEAQAQAVMQDKVMQSIDNSERERATRALQQGLNEQQNINNQIFTNNVRKTLTTNCNAIGTAINCTSY